jgi:CRISPR system Cascade subunit CasE
VSNLYLSRLSLRRDVSTKALLPLFLGKDGEITPLAGKSLMWAAFGGEDGAERDFLWREAGHGVFYALSARVPEVGAMLFNIDAKPFEPEFAAGDRVGFTIRVNPVVRKKNARNPEGHSSKHDVMMNSIYEVPSAKRSEVREEHGRDAVVDWFKRVGSPNGFRIETANLAVVGTRPYTIEKREHDVRFTAVDVDGALTITDPETFTGMLARGIGSAKAYGCGLMMVRRLD